MTAVAHRRSSACTGIPVVTHNPGPPAALAGHWDTEAAQNLRSGTPSTAGQPTRTADHIGGDACLTGTERRSRSVRRNAGPRLPAARFGAVGNGIGEAGNRTQIIHPWICFRLRWFRPVEDGAAWYAPMHLAMRRQDPAQLRSLTGFA
jgi:hypothetical protein